MIVSIKLMIVSSSDLMTKYQNIKKLSSDFPWCQTYRSIYRGQWTDVSISFLGTFPPHLLYINAVFPEELQMASQCTALWLVFIFCSSRWRSGAEKFDSTNPEAFMTSVKLCFNRNLICSYVRELE